MHEEMRNYLIIYEEEAVSLYEFAPNPSEFPYI
jgi:hypothetical protein